MKSRACELDLYGQDDSCAEHDEERFDVCGLSGSELDAELCCVAPTEPEVRDDRYGGPLARVIDRIFDHEQRAAREESGAADLYEALMGLGPARREVAIQSDDRFASYPLAERLLAACREVRNEQPESSLELARLALAVCSRLDVRRYGAGLVADLEARAWAYLGDLWSASSPIAAREAFRLALGHLMRGSGDPLEEAEVVALCAAATDDFETTLDRLDRAGTIYRSAGDSRRLGEVLARKARASGSAGEHDRAIDLLRETVALLRGIAPPMEIAELGADLAHHLVSAGRAEEAWDEIARARSLANGRGRGTGTAVGPPAALRLRLTWIEGRIAAALGLDTDARTHLEQARDGFLATGRHNEAVRAHLDLAALSARADGEGYDRAMERLASETPRVLAGVDLPRESTTVLLLVEQAARRRALRPDLVQAVSGLLDRVV